MNESPGKKVKGSTEGRDTCTDLRHDLGPFVDISSREIYGLVVPSFLCF